jgi:cell division protein FtsI (penicillin-binding protein 3)
MRFNNVFQSKGSAAILMNIHNGNILSLVSLPDFDPNKRENIKDKNYINKITKGVYELGSVFKTFTLAAALDENLIDVDTKFIDLEKSIDCGKNTIREYDKKIPKDLTAEEILIRSGNIGSVRIGQKIGVEKFKQFLTKINLINKIEFDIDEIGIPIPFKWGKCKLATTSFGHGITTTPLQLAKGYAIVTNGGFDVNPTIIKKKNKKLIKYKKRVLKENVSKKINPILRKIVTSKEGTANLADVKGYEIGGKTGTAEKIVSGIYSNQKKINTFASVFPISNPEFVLVVILDEPKINSEYIYNYRDGSNFKLKGSPRNTSGWTSVEATGHIIEKIGPILATKYIEIN